MNCSRPPPLRSGIFIVNGHKVLLIITSTKWQAASSPSGPWVIGSIISCPASFLKAVIQAGNRHPPIPQVRTDFAYIPMIAIRLFDHQNLRDTQS